MDHLLFGKEAKVIFVLIVVMALMSGKVTEPALTGYDIIELATEAAGGEDWKRPRTLQLSGSMTIYPEGRLDGAVQVDDYRMWRKFPAANDKAHQANGKVRFDAKAGGSTVFQISYDGKSTYNQNGLVEAESAGEQWAANFGFGIIRFADDLQVVRMADDLVEGHSCYFIQVIDEEGKGTLFGIDKESYAIRYVGFDTPKGWHHRTYSDFAFHNNPRFRQARRVKLFYDGRKTNDILWPGFIVNEPLDDALFVLSQPQ